MSLSGSDGPVSVDVDDVDVCMCYFKVLDVETCPMVRGNSCGIYVLNGFPVCGRGVVPGSDGGAFLIDEDDLFLGGAH